eukprot:jgi/Bigna1/127381/aug1.4_g2089
MSTHCKAVPLAAAELVRKSHATRMDSITLSRRKRRTSPHAYCPRKRMLKEEMLYPVERKTPEYSPTTSRSSAEHQPVFTSDTMRDAPSVNRRMRKREKKQGKRKLGKCLCGMELQSVWINLEEKGVICPDTECTLDFQNGHAYSAKPEGLQEKGASQTARHKSKLLALPSRTNDKIVPLNEDTSPNPTNL